MADTTCGKCAEMAEAVRVLAEEVAAWRVGHEKGQEQWHSDCCGCYCGPAIETVEATDANPLASAALAAAGGRA
jgi:hypothetical protein